jgi:hypothetical protein
VAVYVIATAPWQRVEIGPNINTGVPTVGVRVTVVDAITEGPLHPIARTLTVAEPVKPAAQVTVAVVPVPEIVLPAPVTLHV